jgi:uncharacterized protein (DUF1015 family)
MVAIRPFSGSRYDARAGDASLLLAPPYDVVDADGRAELAGRSANNCIHVILPEGEGDAKYERGAAEFARLQANALRTDPEPGFYVYHQAFEFAGQHYVRRGFVGLVELTRFGEGPVKPHERTLSGPKEDRLKLMRACDAHLELVFGLFSDPERAWESAVADGLGTPVLEAEFDGCTHTLFRVDDPAACEALQGVLADRSVYIADGHHRYETMCSFADELSAAGRDADTARWGMIYLSNLDDPGLVVRPTHRLVHGLSSLDLEGVLETARASFDVEVVPCPNDAAAMLDTVARAGAERAAFGLHVPGQGSLHLLRLRADFDPEGAGLGQLPQALQRLDVVLLHELVLERGLGIDKAAQSAKTNLRYYKSTEAALAVSADGDTDVQLICFMNPTPVADVVATCDSGEVMPQKSTFFHPKIPTGLVFRPLGPS